MKRIDIEVLAPAAALAGFRSAWRRAAGGGKTEARLAFGSLKDLFSAITEKRLELLRFVAANGGVNTRRLALALGRDYKNVHQDVAALADLGLIEKGARGALSAPFDEIVIHAGIRRAA